MQPQKHSHRTSDNENARRRVMVLRRTCANALCKCQFDVFDARLLELSLLATDTQWESALAYIERTVFGRARKNGVI